MHHADAARLGDLVGDAQVFLAADFSRNVRCYPGAVDPSNVRDPEALWDEALGRGLRAPGFRMVRDGETLPRREVTRSAGIGSQSVNDVIEPNKVLEQFADGASLVLQGLHFSDPILARFANNVALDVDHPVQVNAYLSPADARGLDIHFDYHDVLIVQLAGCKRWRVWDRLERTRTPVRGGDDLAPPTQDELGPPVLERVLEPGDCVHVPRGCPHAPETIDRASTHLTVGIMALTRQRLIEGALRATVGAASTATLVPPGALGAIEDPTAAKVASAEAAEALEALGDTMSGVALRRVLAIEVWRRQPATRLRPRVVPDLGDDRPLDVTPGPLLWAERRSGGPAGEVTFGLGERRLVLPGEAWPVIEAVLDEQRTPLRPTVLSGELAGGATPLDTSSVRTVLTRLAADGVLAHA